MNLLSDRLITIEFECRTTAHTLPGVFATLVRDEVDCFPALRAHQVPAWHMFLVQLGAIAMHRAGMTTPPAEELEWHRILQVLNDSKFPDDEPWRLIVDDHAKPAFLQPPVPDGKGLGRIVSTPDELDMVITSKNHDLKKAVAGNAAEDDWIFALVSLQTCEGYGGSGNYGIARMNGGSSSRVCLGIVPMDAPGSDHLEFSPGVRLRRDLEQLAARRAQWLEPLASLYPSLDGAALLWTLPWPDGECLQVTALDPLFIEVCRRVRLTNTSGRIEARAGTSDGRRVAAKNFNGVLGDPWAPVNRVEAKSLTLGEDGDFDFTKMSELLFSSGWQLPLLATIGSSEPAQAKNWVVIAQAFARGDSKTGGFKERVIPCTGKAAKGILRRRTELHNIATFQIGEIKIFRSQLIDVIGVFVRGGIFMGDVSENSKRDARKRQNKIAEPFARLLELEADRLFFPALWARFEAEEKGDDAALEARADFLRSLDRAAVRLLESALDDLPCASLIRPRAETRARARYFGGRGRAFEGVDFTTRMPTEDVAHVDA